MTAISLAHADVLDLPEVMRVMEDSFDPEYGEAWTAPQCAGLISLPGVWLVIARQDAEPLGFALSRVVAGEAELLLLAVRRSAQRRGIGAQLLERFICDAGSRGATKLHLEVRHGNPAVELYKSAGFREVGRRFNYYRGAAGQVFDALTLARTTNS
ncbi:MAG TPA: GNAT family N-acetyltransferase [Allosphingosinicella sp.]|nr:GNAT family N-acetyltransferase [Allosphingosinicella sp.]